jgi:hypothetical protein
MFKKNKTKTRQFVLLLVTGLLISGYVNATPSTSYWAPSTTYLQPFGVAHITFDTYFNMNTDFSTDVGLTIGLLPLKHLQLEAGFDFLFPSPYVDDSGDKILPILLNGKIGIPEDAFFTGQPGLAFGIFNLGFVADKTDYNILYAMIGKTMLPEWGPLYFLGNINFGFYYGLNKNLLTSSSGEVDNFGFIASWNSPSIPIPGNVIDHLLLTWDIMTGENALGATGGGLYIYFTPTTSLLVGPVFFFDKTAAGVPDSWIWTLQLDIDVDLTKPFQKKS